MDGHPADLGVFADQCDLVRVDEIDLTLDPVLRIVRWAHTNALAGLRAAGRRAERGARLAAARGHAGGADDGASVTAGDRSVVLSVAAAMFVAELGDTTMLATAAVAAPGRPVLVWIGATAGITLAGVLGVLLGRVLGSRLPARATRIGSGALLAGFGLTLRAADL